jgi:hypothetical protein
MHTSLLMLALAGPAAAPAPVLLGGPNWQESYRTAREVGREQGKPLAVFIASGPGGWEKLTDDGKPTRRARQLLAEGFVCLYVDRTTPEGRRLADAFEVPSGNSLVLSTRDGEGQAFAYRGTMSRAELEETLRKYSNGKVVRQTETLDRARYSYLGYPDSSMRPAAAPGPQATTPSYGTATPAGYSPPTMYAPMSFGGFRGGFSGGGGC